MKEKILYARIDSGEVRAIGNIVGPIELSPVGCNCETCDDKRKIADYNYNGDLRLIPCPDCGDAVRKPDVKKLQAEVDRWNETVPVGSRVVYVEIMGDRHGKEFVTRSAAEVLSGHTAVVWLAGKAGCVALNHCTVVEDQ